MTVKEKATSYHNRGFNCAQSVLFSVGAYTGLDEKTGLAIAAGFGGGLRCGEVCGAVSGAVMAAGMCCPYVDEHDLAAKEKIADLSRTLTAAFQARFGALRCEEIKGDKAMCPVYIEFMAELAEKTLQELNSK